MEDAAGFAHSSYGQNTRLLNQAINRLRECGSETILGEMPKIAVIGNQSAGKSSLIEAMSGIRVPRQVGTCTRCPMEVVLSHSAEDLWKCQISLRIMYDEREHLLPTPKVVPFGAPMVDPDEVEKRLRRAQDAILHCRNAPPPGDDDNPHDPADMPPQENFVPSSEALGFSRNVVRLDVSGPDLVDVTFIDLPGIITNANQKWVHTVTSLVSEYISQPNCLILVAINMADDIENQGASSLARTFDSDGKRTIGPSPAPRPPNLLGVLTKADMVTDEERFERWRAIIAGEDLVHRLVHGYYLTMQKRPAAQSSWQDNLRNESQFFRTSPFWTKLGRGIKSVGTVELRKKLSLELSKLIRNRIPGLVQEINKCARLANEEMRALPKPATDPPHLHLLRLCNTFVAQLTDYIKGENDKKDLQLMISEADRRFLATIKASVGQFGLADHDEKQRGILVKTANELLFLPPAPMQTARGDNSREESVGNSDDDCVDITPTAASQRQPKTPKKSKGRKVRPLPGPRPDTPPSENLMQFTGELIELAEIRGLIRREKARKLPGSASAVLQERLIRQSIRPWEQCAQTYFTEVLDAVQEVLTRICHCHFARYSASGLLDAVWQIISDVIKELSLQTNAAISEQYKMEERPFTQDEACLNSTMTMLFKRITDYRHAEIFEKTKTGELYAGFLAPDEYDPELNLIAHVLAYINVAYKRFGDMIPMRVEERFQHALATSLQKQLLDKMLIGEGSEERCRAWMEDAPELIARRKEIVRRKEILRMADQEIRKFQGNVGFNNHDFE